MILVSFSRTMARAVPVRDEGLVQSSRRRRTFEELAEASRGYENNRRFRLEESRQRAEREAQQQVEMLKRAAEQHRLETLVRAYPSPSDVIRDIAKQHGMSVESLMSRNREHPIIAARFDAIAAVFDECRDVEGNRFSYRKIGDLFGNLDHSTVRNALQKRGRL